MVVIAGALYFDGAAIKDNVRENLTASLSRKSQVESLCYSNDSFYLTIGCFRDCRSNEYFYENERSVTVLLGNPYLEKCREGNKYRLQTQLLAISHICESSKWDEFSRNCRGVFSAIFYDKKSQRLTFISDKLGIWPIYYFVDNTKVVFSSALRILESSSLVLRNFDSRGVSEIVSFGFPLAKRTPYKDVKRIAAAEIVQFDNKYETTVCYWRWDSIPETKNLDEAALVEKSFREFEDGIKIRLSGDTVALSFLSGGLDSRCIVSSLSQLCTHVHAFNFSQPNSQDRFFAAQFAEVIGADYSECEFVNSANWSQMLADSWRKKSSNTKYMPERPWMVWSGDGGSVGTGFVYLNQDIIEAAIQGSDIEKIISLYLDYNKISLPLRILNKSFRREVCDLVFLGVRDEMERFTKANPARALHLFLMENDQRRHLDRHFENLDIHNLEFHLPFFDSFFLETVFSLPIEYCVNHGFYSDWFQYFPSVAKTVPWQTYPGHKSCPLSMEHTLQYQWEDVDRKNYTKGSSQNIASHFTKYFTDSFPVQILDRNSLSFALLLHFFKVKEFDYLFDAANIYIEYFLQCKND